MLVVSIVGGLGNQMYGYALYRTLLERGRDVYMDLSFYDHQNSPFVAFREYELSRVFNITERTMKISELKYFFMRVAKKLKVPGLVGVYQEKKGGFDANQKVFEIENGIISGCWGGFRYSAEIEDILRKEYTFKKPLTGKSAEVIDKIRNCNSVSISFRRTDYLNWNGVLPADYYTNAIRYIQERVPNAKFFCTSDDIDYCKNTYGGGGMILSSLTGRSVKINISICKLSASANIIFSLTAHFVSGERGSIRI